jgi:hypothetical protein
MSFLDCYYDEFVEIVCYKAQYYLGKAYDVFNLRLIKVLFSFLRFYCSIFSCLSHIVVGCVILCIIESNIYMCYSLRLNFKFNLNIFL